MWGGQIKTIIPWQPAGKLINSILTWLEWLLTIRRRFMVAFECFIYRSMTCDSQASLTLLLLQPFNVAMKRALSSLVKSSTQVFWRSPELRRYAKRWGVQPIEETEAKILMNSRFPSCLDFCNTSRFQCGDCCYPFQGSVKPIRNPFSSELLQQPPSKLVQICLL